MLNITTTAIVLIYDLSLSNSLNTSVYILSLIYFVRKRYNLLIYLYDLIGMHYLIFCFLVIKLVGWKLK